MATIYDVAKLAGVSPATVSRVLNGNYPVSEKRRQLVREAIRELDFRPSIVGRNLGRGVNRTVLVASSTFSPVMAGECVRGIHDVLRAQNYDMLMSLITPDLQEDGNFRTEAWSDHVRYVQRGLVGGAILLGPVATSTLRQIGDIPVILSNTSGYAEQEPGYPYCISFSDYEAEYDITTRLIARGHRRFGFFAYRRESEPGFPAFSRNRERGMRDALAEFGLADIPVTRAICHGDVSDCYLDALQAAQEFLRLPRAQMPDVILCCFDTLALALIHALQGAGLRVPEDVAVVGFDNSPATRYCQPQITSLFHPSYEAGVASARLMIDLLEGRQQQPVHITMPHKIVVRGSTGPLPEL